jgi:lipoprotein-anchoring transpeptidase ErfK/SrfK
MNPVVKYVGGLTLATALAFGAAAVGGYSLEAPSQAQEEQHSPLASLIELDRKAVEGGDQLAEAFDAQAPAAVEIAAEPETAPPAAAADEPFVIKRILPIEGPIKYGQWYWDEEGVPAGPLVMTVDLQARVLSVFRGGYEIGATAVLLGTPEHPTPVGMFPILSKERYNKSEKYNDAPMPWTMRLTRDGVAIHGGSTIQNGYASHGCISAPDDFVSKLYAIAKKGDRVIVTDGKTTGMGQKLIDS